MNAPKLTIIDSIDYTRLELARATRICCGMLERECPGFSDMPPEIEIRKWHHAGDHYQLVNKIVLNSRLDLEKAMETLGHEMRHAFQHKMGWLYICENTGARTWTTEAEKIIVKKKDMPDPCVSGEEYRRYMELPWERDACEFAKRLIKKFLKTK